MNKIAVNPKLFITCRLCLDDLGKYIIVPSVKDQIEYCFGIQVDTFDRLPQLICEKCEQILSKYSTIKKTFVDTQNELKLQVSNDKLSIGTLVKADPPDNTTECKENECTKKEPSTKQESNSEKAPTTKSEPSTNKKPSNSSSSSDIKHQGSYKKKKNKTYPNSKEQELTWPSSYRKHFVCRICGYPWSNIMTLRNHINNRHREIYKKYGYIFKRTCQVSLHKADEKTNFTRSRAKVVHDRRKIIKNTNSDYHIMYTTKDYRYKAQALPQNNIPPQIDKTSSGKTDKKQSRYSSYSTDDEVVVKRPKRRRIESNSSNETVKLDSKPQGSDPDMSTEESTGAPAADPCISLDDSSGTESDNNDPTTTRTVNESTQDSHKEPDYKPDHRTINEIISVCRNKYIKKHYQDTDHPQNTSDIANKLQHKIFSIGRKTITKKKGVNCTPLLRFLECKNLDIAWLPRDSSSDQVSNNIRIMQRPKSVSEKWEDIEMGWADYTPSKNVVTKTSKSSNSEQKMTKLSLAKKNCSIKTCNNSEPSNLIQAQSISSSKPCNISEQPSNLNQKQSNNSSQACNGGSLSESPTPCSDAAVLTNDFNLTFTETKKLLNSNPVANPKQLPKKIVTIELKQNVSAKQADTVSQEDHSDLCMPIITSTTSLASAFSLQDDNDDSKNSNGNEISEIRPDGPRIKVKPASELMTAETLNRLNNAEETPMAPTLINIVGKGIPLNVQTVTVPLFPMQQNIQVNKNATGFVTMPHPSTQNDFMILDTVDLPNTKTNSPYLYFRKLLQLHYITLLDNEVKLTDDYIRLLKIRVQYRQENSNEPVILSLALFCLENEFCLKVRDRYDKLLDITQMSPNWQWELLKIYQGEVVNKILSNAQKISQSAYYYTNSFLCLLKSINMTRDSTCPTPSDNRLLRMCTAYSPKRQPAVGLS